MWDRGFPELTAKTATHSWSLQECAAPGRSSQCGTAVFLGLPPTRNALLVPPGVCGSWPAPRSVGPRFGRSSKRCLLLHQGAGQQRIRIYARASHVRALRHGVDLRGPVQNARRTGVRPWHSSAAQFVHGDGLGSRCPLVSRKLA